MVRYHCRFYSMALGLWTAGLRISDHHVCRHCDPSLTRWPGSTTWQLEDILLGCTARTGPKLAAGYWWNNETLTP